MIARVKFEGIVKEGKKKSVLPDHVDIHVPAGDLNKGKEIFQKWLEGPSAGIRGASGVFHPLQGYGDIKIKGVSEGE